MGTENYFQNTFCTLKICRRAMFTILKTCVVERMFSVLTEAHLYRGHGIRVPCRNAPLTRPKSAFLTDIKFTSNLELAILLTSSPSSSSFAFCNDELR